MMFVLGFVVAAFAVSEPVSEGLKKCSKKNAPEVCGERKCVDNKTKDECFWNMLDSHCHCQEHLACAKDNTDKCGEFQCVLNHEVEQECNWDSVEFFCHCSNELKKKANEVEAKEDVEDKEDKEDKEVDEKQMLVQVKQLTTKLQGTITDAASAYSFSLLFVLAAML